MPRAAQKPTTLGALLPGICTPHPHSAPQANPAVHRLAGCLLGGKQVQVLHPPSPFAPVTTSPKTCTRWRVPGSWPQDPHCLDGQLEHVLRPPTGLSDLKKQYYKQHVNRFTAFMLRMNCCNFWISLNLYKFSLYIFYMYSG